MSILEDAVLKKILKWIAEKNAENIEVIDISDKSAFADAMIICSGSGDIHNKAIAENVLEHAKADKVYVLGKEGFESAMWILIDFGNIILHVFNPENRNKYNLEDLWTKARNNQE